MKRVVITGASSGMGYQAVLAMANMQEDIHVVGIARSIDKLEKLKQEFELNEVGEKRFDFITLDLADFSETDLRSQLNTIFKLKGAPRIDVLINNAGYLVNKPFMKTSDEEWMRTLQVNLLATVRLTRIFHSFLKNAFHAHIVNIGSMGGVQGTEKFPGISAYSVSKGAVNTLTESLAREFAADQIAVNCINPGAVQTDMLETAFPGFEAPISAESFGQYIAHYALTAHQYMNGQLVDVAFRR
jgi:short-subunit dehydrogenase